MTAQAPTIHAHASHWESACGFKARYPESLIVRSGAKPFATYYVVNRAFFERWMDDEAVLPNEREIA